MRRYTTTTRLLAAATAGVAGFVDAIGFLELSGYFVSFMSGNSTQFGLGIGGGDSHAVLVAGGLIATFLVGVVLSALMSTRATNRPAAVLASVGVLLGIATLCAIGGAPHVALALSAFAMGVVNAAYARDGETLGVTYVTGALVKAGQQFAAALAGGDRWGWVWNALLWAGLVVGAILGAIAWHGVGLAGLGIGATATLLLAGCAWRLDR